MISWYDEDVLVCYYAVLGNHLHVILRTRPDVVAAWPDDEVARRWWNLFPQCRDAEGGPAAPEPHQLCMLTAQPEALAERRRRLSSLSWFMRLGNPGLSVFMGDCLKGDIHAGS